MYIENRATNGNGESPESAIDAVPQIFVREGLPFSNICRGNRDHLLARETSLQIPLMIAATGIGSVLFHADNSVQHKVAILATVERNIIFFQRLGDRRERYDISPTGNKRVHA